jgi:hypothetical protein
LNEIYQDYINRVARLALPISYPNQLQNIQKSPKFERGQPTSFPGYSVITPPMENDPVNETFYNQLTSWQEMLCQKLDPDFFIPVPPASFHLTVADLIWSSSYLQAIEENPDFEQQLRQSIAESFTEYSKINQDKNYPIWRSTGLIIKPRAVVVSLIPKDELSYRKIIDLRRCVYQNPRLIALGIEQQYDLTAHITVGYFGDLANDRNYIPEKQIDRLFAELSEQWLLSEDNSFAIETVELRKFDDMMRYYRENDWSAIEL